MKNKDNLKKNLIKAINENISLKKKLSLLNDDVSNAIKIIFDTLKKGNKVLICGNGGWVTKGL
tara:strand:- start:187 stop:375 length:189 start_codon:yes stop_codon:yes gene_type:complete